MSEIRLNIDGREVLGFEGQTILQIAQENGISIPTLCHDDRVKMYGSCGVCVVDAQGSAKLLRSCSTFAANGMILRTDSARVRASRKTALELLLSDHTGDCRPPCVLACPAQTDCQGYVGLIANGQYAQALELIKDKIPLPSSIGRVCPHPCEEACRRELVEEPISIAALKQYVGDLDLNGEQMYTIPVGEPTGKKVAIIGGGPGGLTAAYFLRGMGHGATIYDAMPHMGGMLRYGIPEYRLPKKLLQQEIDAIKGMGVQFNNNINIGRDITLDYLCKNYDAVIVAVGAWSSTGMRCSGENLDGVVGGIDFLREVTLNHNVFTGRKIAIVGGGNTAMDACRTAVRLGASEVYNIYRRTKSEMPAEQIEILEAEEEGVIFKNLTNPLEFMGENGEVNAVRLQIMELGEPDSSGRRAPVALEGVEETIEIDTVIIAIGQKLAPAGFEQIDKTKWGTIAADENTFLTNLEGVFAIGDATNGGADIAITAIGDAKKAVAMVDKFLNGEQLSCQTPYLVKDEKTSEDFAEYAKEPRAKMPHRCASERKGDFLPVNLSMTEREAKREANRCLECGCHDYFECKLIDYANQYSVQPTKYDGQIHKNKMTDDHPFIHRNPDKCILCGLCVRVCDEVVGMAALGLVNRGFDTIVKPALDIKLSETDCISCGQCVNVCPTGALTETMMIKKQVPLHETLTETACSFCSVGCKTKLTSNGSLLIRNLPTATQGRDALLCMKGRFGFGEIAKNERVISPKINGEDASFEQAIVYTNKKFQSLQTQFGNQSVAVAISDRYTTEEIFMIKQYANNALKTDRVYCFNKTDSGLADVIGQDLSTCTFDEMENTELIVLFATDIMKNHAVVGMRIKRAVENGAKLLIIGSGENLLWEHATMQIDHAGDLLVFKQMLKVMLDTGRGKDINGYDDFAKSLANVSVSEDAKAAAQLYLGAKKAVVLFQKYSITADAVRLIADMAVVSGHCGSPRDGIIQLLPGCNAQGIANLEVLDGQKARDAIADGSIRGLFIFGEDVTGVDLSKLDFLAVQDIHLTATAAKADVVFPASSFAEIDGTYISADGGVQTVRQAVPSVLELDSFAQMIALSGQAGAPMRYRNVKDVQRAIAALPKQQVEDIALVAPTGNELFRSKGTSTNALYVSLMDYANSKELKV